MHILEPGLDQDQSQDPTESVDTRTDSTSRDIQLAGGTVNSRPPASKASKRVIIIVGLAALLTAVSIPVYYFAIQASSDQSKLKSAPPAVTISTTTAKLSNVDEIVSVTGSVSAWDPLSVGAEVSGLRINSVNVEEGDLVRKGQALAVLNSALLEAQLEEAKAKLQSAEANLKKSIQPNRAEDIDGLRAALLQAEATTVEEEAHRKQLRISLQNAELNEKRWIRMAKAGAASYLDAETKHVAAETARDDLESSESKIKAAKFFEDQARQRLLAAERGGRVEDVSIARAQIAEMKAQVHHLSKQIEQTLIRSPDDGLVVKRDAHIGDITTSGTPLFAIVRQNRIELRAEVSDLELHAFKPGQKVQIASTADGSDRLAAVTGKVTLVSPQVDPQTRLGTVRIALPSNAGLKPGMFVRGHVTLGHKRAITVPAASVVRRNGESFVFALNGNRVVSTTVKTGLQTSKYVEILSGLAEGVVVADQGARFLSDNDVVQVSK